MIKRIFKTDSEVLFSIGVGLFFSLVFWSFTWGTLFGIATLIDFKK